MTRLSFRKIKAFSLACLALAWLVSTLAWCQVGTDEPEDSTSTVDEAPLEAPPPVSGNAYATTFTSETESNFLRGGVTVSAAYSSNVAGSTTPIADGSFSVWPTLGFDKVTTRGHYMLSCSPGFTFYRHTSALNQGNQGFLANVRYRLSPNLTASIAESFHRTSNVLNQPDPLSTTAVSGTAPAPAQAIVTPVGTQMSNFANAQLTYQLGDGSMIGASGNSGSYTFSNAETLSGAYDSRSAAGSMFYSRRLLDKYNLGANYQYQDINSYQAGGQNNTTTHTQTIFFFLSIYLKPTLSVSFSGGPQHSTSVQGTLPVSQSWSPLTMVSIGWQGSRTSLAASYARVVNGAGGLNGTFHSMTANTSARWQMARSWSAGVSASYASYKTLTPSFVLASPGGHTLSGTVSVDHTLGEHLSVDAGYSWAQQSYGETTTVSSYPNINRGYISISYQFARPLQ